MAKYRANSQDTWKTLKIKALDSMPVGTIVNYDGQASDIPVGWENYGTGQIKKTSETTPTMGSIVNAYTTSTKDGYSCNYMNDKLKWKLVGEATGTTGITLPDDYEELMICTEESNEQQYSKIIPKITLRSGYYMYEGYYLSSTNYAVCTWQYNSSNNKIALVLVNRAGTYYSSSAKTYLYYR